MDQRKLDLDALQSRITIQLFTNAMAEERIKKKENNIDSIITTRLLTRIEELDAREHRLQNFKKNINQRERRATRFEKSLHAREIILDTHRHELHVDQQTLYSCEQDVEIRIEAFKLLRERHINAQSEVDILCAEKLANLQIRENIIDERETELSDSRIRL